MHVYTHMYMHICECIPVYLRVHVGGVHVWRTCMSVLCVCVCVNSLPLCV